MIDILIIIFFSELVIILGWYVIDSVFDLVEKLKEKHNNDLCEYEKEVYAPLGQALEEGDFSDGFIEDLKSYDDRINQMKMELDEQPEIITDEQERERE